MIKKLLTTLLFITSLVISLVVLEALIRVFIPRHDPSGTITFHYDENRVYLGRKNTSGRQWRASGDFDVNVTFNALGFRDTKDLRRSTENDIFVVGDSFSFGWGVEEAQRYSSLLQEMTGTDVYNISIPTSIRGYGRLLTYAQQYGATFGHLIIGLCMENDLKDYSAPVTPPPPKMTLAKKTKLYFKRKTALYSALTSLVHSNPGLMDSAIRLRLIDFNNRNLRPSRISPPILQSSVEELKRLIDRSDAARITLVIIPSRALWVGDEQSEADQVHRDFVNELENLNLDAVDHVIDLRPAFEAGGNPLRFHFRFDGHWNADGHRLAAEVIRSRFEIRLDSSEIPISDSERDIAAPSRAQS